MRGFLIFLALGAVLLIPPVAFFHYVLPQVDVVRVINTEVRRIDATAGNTVDVMFISTIDAESGSTRVYRNEDTGWSFPPYFKFDSADLQAEAQQLSNRDSDATPIYAAVRHYGWRFQIFSMFPNAVEIYEVEEGYTHFPYFNIAFFVVLIGLAWAIRRRILKIMAWWQGRQAGA